MELLIKRKTLYAFLLEIGMENDLEFIVSVRRLQTGVEGHFDSYGQSVIVPDSIERTLMIFNKWEEKIENGEYEPPTQSDYNNQSKDLPNAAIGLTDFPEIEGLTIGIFKNTSNHSD